MTDKITQAVARIHERDGKYNATISAKLREQAQLLAERAAWLEAHEKVIAQQAGEIERLAVRVAEMEADIAHRDAYDAQFIRIPRPDIAPAGEGS